MLRQDGGRVHVQRSREFEQHHELERKDTLPSIQGILDSELVCHKFEGELFVHAENGWIEDKQRTAPRTWRPGERPSTARKTA